MPRQYRAGSRRYNPDGKMSEGRIAWLNTLIGQMVLMRATEEEQKESSIPEAGPNYRLYFPRPNARPMVINLTALTHEEFVALKKFFNLAFELAEPVILERDRIAQDAFDKGDDSFSRSYRQIPQLVIRERTLGENDQSVLQRSDDLPDGDESEAEEVEEVRMSDGGVRRAGDELAPSESPATVSQDNNP